MSTLDISAHFHLLDCNKDMILAKELKGEEKTGGGIIIPETSRFANPFYEVIQIGPDVKHTKIGDFIFPEKGSMMRLGKHNVALVHEETQLACKLTPENFNTLFGVVEARRVIP